LGVERGKDTALLEPADLAFDGIPEWERKRFEERYPRHLSLPNLELDVEYEPRRKRVTVVRQSGKRRDPPKRLELPAWPGWSIQYRNGSRVVPIQG
ncbi:MAG TPA: ATP-dependent RNA helicase, partial [Gammaproteobacteria bacterium]|nr:ATP-dependent RNA helicase [Gammaproteobacteria bacterium]